MIRTVNGVCDSLVDGKYCQKQCDVDKGHYGYADLSEYECNGKDCSNLRIKFTKYDK